MSVEPTKICKLCGEEKRTTDFSKGRNVCKPCRVLQTQEYYAKNKEEILKKSRIYTRNNKEKRAATLLRWQQNNRDKTSQYGQRWYNKNKETRQLQILQWEYSLAKFSTYHEKLSPYEEVLCGENDSLLVRCSYCNKFFTPKNTFVKSRLGALTGYNEGEGRFYCSKECKNACPNFNQKKYSKIEKELLQKNGLLGTAREVPADFRKMALEDRDWTCEKCGSTEDGLHVHHIEGYTEAPMFAADINNVIVVCQDCHINIHKQPGCSYHDYSRCKPEVNIPEQEDQQLASTGTE